jgi:acetyl-CoA carboxylase biotin carboxyl carrier protein
VGDIFDVLSDDEVRQIASLVEKLDRSRFDFLQLDVGNVKLTIGKGDVAPTITVGGVPKNSIASPAVAPSKPAAKPQEPAHIAGSPAATADAGKQSVAQKSPVEDGTVAITAPMMGRFYTKSEPDAAPFVSVGSEVNADSTVGLIEVMKVFTAVRAGVSGTILEFCVQDNDFIEYGQVLFRVRPQP